MSSNDEWKKNFSPFCLGKNIKKETFSLYFDSGVLSCTWPWAHTDFFSVIFFFNVLFDSGRSLLYRKHLLILENWNFTTPVTSTKLQNLLCHRDFSPRAPGTLSCPDSITFVLLLAEITNQPCSIYSVTAKEKEGIKHSLVCFFSSSVATILLP